MAGARLLSQAEVPGRDPSDEPGGDQITANVVAPGFIDGIEFFRGRMTDERQFLYRTTGRSDPRG